MVASQYIYHNPELCIGNREKVDFKEMFEQMQDIGVDRQHLPQQLERDLRASLYPRRPCDRTLSARSALGRNVACCRRVAYVGFAILTSDR